MYPGNHTESDMLYVPRNLKTRPGAPETHLAYITDDEAEMLQQYKPGTPHEGPHNIPNFDTWGYDPNSGAGVTVGSTADGGGVWSGDPGGNQPPPGGYTGSGEHTVDQGHPGGVTSSNEWIDTSNLYEEPYTPPKEIYGDIAGATTLADQIHQSGISASQLAWAQKHGSLPPQLAEAMGIAFQKDGLWYNKKTGERYIPKDHGLSNDQWGSLSNFMTMREEGTYGGVSGAEAATNEMKNNLLQAQEAMNNATNEQEWNLYKQQYDEALSSLNNLEIGHLFNQGYNKDTNKWTGQFQEGFGPDQFTGSFVEDTFSEIENDPQKYEKFLNIGNLPFDDPLSGIIDPIMPRHFSDGSGSGFSWGPRYGGYGGNRYINQIPLLQAQLSDPYSEARYGTDPMQRWMVESHSPMYAARGGIMNLRR